MTLYSHSRLSSFENCPRQFRYRYIDKLPSESEGIEAFMGKRVHEILERLYHHVARHGRPPSLAQVHDRFRKDWLLHWHPEVRIVREECDEDHYRQGGLRCLENYYRGHYPFDDGETIGIEHKIQLALDEAGRYKLRGVIDRVVRRPEGRYEIHDYKTGALPPRARIEQDRQLALYQLGLEQSYEDVHEVDLIWHYVAHNRTFQQRRTPDQLLSLRGATIELIDRIEATVDYPTRAGPLCSWCEYRQICPAITGDTRAERGPTGPEPPPVGDQEPPLAARADPIPPPRAPVQLSLL